MADKFWKEHPKHPKWFIFYCLTTWIYWCIFSYNFLFLSRIISLYPLCYSKMLSDAKLKWSLDEFEPINITIVVYCPLLDYFSDCRYWLCFESIAKAIFYMSSSSGKMQKHLNYNLIINGTNLDESFKANSFSYSFGDCISIWNNSFFKVFRIRHGNIYCCHSLYWSTEVVESWSFIDDSNDLSSNAWLWKSILNCYKSSSFLHRVDDSISVQRFNSA